MPKINWELWLPRQWVGGWGKRTRLSKRLETHEQLKTWDQARRLGSQDMGHKQEAKRPWRAIWDAKQETRKTRLDFWEAPVLLQRPHNSSFRGGCCWEPQGMGRASTEDAGLLPRWTSHHGASMAPLLLWPFITPGQWTVAIHTHPILYKIKRQAIWLLASLTKANDGLGHLELCSPNCGNTLVYLHFCSLL